MIIRHCFTPAAGRVRGSNRDRRLDRIPILWYYLGKLSNYRTHVENAMTTIPKKYTRRESERLRRIELILDSAEELFLEKGFTPTTMNDIGEAAEFGRATLYHYFPSKEAIYVAILERAMDSLISRARASVARARSAAGKIEQLKDSLLAFVQNRRNIFRLHFITRFEVLPHLDEELAKRLDAKIKELDGIFHEIYEEGVKAGEFRPDDPLAIGDIFFAQIIGLMLFSSTQILATDLAASVNKATRFFLENIRPKNAAPCKRNKEGEK